MVARRTFLMTGAAGIVILGGGAAAYRLLHSDLSAARQPWRQAGESFGDPRIDALAYAVLAPSPHNRPQARSEAWPTGVPRLVGVARAFASRSSLSPE